jgi:ABC-type branched-subunit amino acid transport system ATPase component/predicted MFS family arabinose efflux permease
MPRQPRKRTKAAAAGNGAAAHVAEIHRAEVAVEDIEQGQARLRERARRIVGVTGTGGVPPFAQIVSTSGLGWYPLVALGALVVVNQFQAFAVSILGPDISRALGISRGLLAFLLVLRLLAAMLASLPMAAAVQQRPRRAVLAKVTGLVWSVATLLSAFVTSAIGLFALLLVHGVATGSVESVHAPLVMDAYQPGGRVRALTAYRGSLAVGAVVAALLAAMVTGALGLPWRAVFLVMGAISLAAVAGSWRLRDPGYGRWDTERIREEVRADAGREAPQGDAEPELGFFEALRRVMVVPSMKRLLAAWAAIGVMVFPFTTYLFFFLDERWNMGPGGRSLVFVAAWACAVGALFWFGRRGEAMFAESPERLVRFIAVLLLGAAAGLVVGVVSPVFPIMLVGFAVVVSVVVLLAPAVYMVALSLVQPHMRAHASALLGIFLTGVGGIGGVALLGGLDRRFGISGALLCLCGPILVAAWIAWRAAPAVPADLDRMIDEIVEREEVRIMQNEGVHLPMLSCRHLDFSYGQLQVLFDVNFTVDDGEMVALLGTNGAGKSTLLRVISGLGLPSRGSVHFRGSEITYLDAERRLGLGITQIPGGKAVFGPLSVADNLRVYGHSLGRRRGVVDQGIEATFEAFPALAGRRNQLASTLSGGEQQMLALVKAFILEPRILLIDELSLGLAPKIVGELLEMVRRVNKTGTAIVLVEQSVNIALSLVDHAYFMEKGEIRFDGRARDLLERRDLLRSVFLEGATKGLK